ncbi:hypothetical protein J4Q44_G00095120 [Coregonus suidteri]|uniref:Uncharacterized protein n=1 Tax=Coregonus suidteri TaxID=861788 RepID=A0AAN8QXJ2_9TELE
MCQKDLADVQHHLQADLLRRRLGETTRGGKTGCRQDWMLDKSKEWEKKAEHLVDSLDSLQCHQLLEEGGDKRDQYRVVAWISGASPSPRSPSAVTMPQRNLSTRPASPYPYGQYLGQEKKLWSSAPCGLKDSEGMQHLLTVQKRLKNLQSVEFQRNIKGLLRAS